ncbi:hypothetical protein CPB83DRAFT_860456 [Crepidotus variabilis]|uniref:S-adenosyl-L-methionine-dependent methyltransferase n=1 Tax=Crepidotus variabilis TaxID=179855 RepID=A0A9P6JLN8_9AGAR|nr:hypothetical protein CPB83DRAFT_860456 [Crepidotus variabilis]
MKLMNAFSLWDDIRIALQIAFFPTIKEVWKKPGLLWPSQWRRLSGIFMAHTWLVFGVGVDENAKVPKARLLSPSDEEKRPQGIVLDLGAAHGHTVKYLDRDRVSHYVALEPNTLMHPKLRSLSSEAGFYESDGSLIMLSCGAEDTKAILSSLKAAGISTDKPPVDTIISIMTLCTVPEPQRTINSLVRDVLKSGGAFMIYEHVLSHRDDVAWWQRFWAPLWTIAFDGCRLDRPTDAYLKMVEIQCADGTKESAWKEWKSWLKEGEDEECLFWHAVGRYVKK